MHELQDLTRAIVAFRGGFSALKSSSQPSFFNGVGHADSAVAVAQLLHRSRDDLDRPG
jgi:hypothetical protein